MNQRLQQFIAAENLSQSQFADALGVARASVSHILAGRNKPGFDFIESMSRHYPSLNIEWLITGKGKMYKSQNSTMTAEMPPLASPAPAATAASAEPKSDAEADLFSAPEPKAVSVPAPAPAPATTPASASASASAPAIAASTKKERAQTSASTRNIEKIIVFYDDGSFQELK